MYLSYSDMCSCSDICCQEVDTCGDPMDLDCIRQCIGANFDSDMCMSCEPTRPLIVVSNEVDDMTAQVLENIANNKLSMHT